MAWVYLAVAGVFEVVWATFLKFSEGFTRLFYSILTLATMAVSFYFLAQATKTLPIGTAYAIWTGIGAVGSVVVGVLIFKEVMTPLRALFTIMLLAGIIGLKLSSPH